MSNTTTYKHLIDVLTARAAVTPGAAKDLARVLNPENALYGFTEACMLKGQELGFDWEVIFSLPQKQIFRATQFINALLSGIPANFDYTHARILCAMRLAGSYDLNTDAIIHLTAGSRVTGDANLRGVTSSAVNRMFALSHKLGTVQTKISNMTGKNGFSQITGMTFGEPSKQNHALSLNLEHPAVVAFFAVIDNATAGQIDAMSEGKGE